MFDEKTIYTRLVMALSDAIIVEQTPAHRHKMEALQKILIERYKPKYIEIESKTNRSP